MGVTSRRKAAVFMRCRYVNQDEPALKGHSVTVKADEEQIRNMRERAAQTFRPEMAQLLQVRPHH